MLTKVEGARPFGVLKVCSTSITGRAIGATAAAEGGQTALTRTTGVGLDMGDAAGVARPADATGTVVLVAAGLAELGATASRAESASALRRVSRHSALSFPWAHLG